MKKELQEQINELRDTLTQIKMSGDVSKKVIQKTQQKLDKLIEKMNKNGDELK
jgi:uncharacterized coiled-coil protein SlyX